MLIHVVRHDPHLRVPEQHVTQRSQITCGGCSAGGIIREIQDQPFGPGRDRGLEVFRSQAKAVVLRAVDHDRRPADDTRHQSVGAPIGCGDDDLVARVHRGHERVEDHALAAIGHHDLVEGELEIIVALELALDGLLEHGDPVLRRVFGLSGETSLVAGLDCMDRAVEIGLTDRQRDHLLTLGAHGPRADRHGDGRGGREPVEAVGEPGRYGRDVHVSVDRGRSAGCACRRRAGSRCRWRS